jgi:hypothetical protein
MSQTGQIVEAPKSISCSINDNTAHAVFDRQELKRYLRETEETILWVEDAKGNRAPIRVEFLRETEFEKD